MKEYLIVDGYNIIYAWPELNEAKEDSLEYARAKLVEILANYASLSGQEVVLVFDAYRQKKRIDRAEKIDGIEVIYTRYGETADTLIERLAGELVRKGAVYVATSDWAEQGVVFGRGAYRITPEELRIQVDQVKKESEALWSQTKPMDNYLESHLKGKTRLQLERWRRKKE